MGVEVAIGSEAAIYNGLYSVLCLLFAGIIHSEENCE